MPTEAPNPDEALSYRGELPLRWIPLTALPTGAAAERLDEANTRLLGAVGLIEDSPKLSDEPSATELELLRIHQKLNLLIDLLGSVLRQQQPRPERVPLRLSWRGVSWHAVEPLPKVGDLGLVEIYLKETLPQPLHWPARIVAVTQAEVSAEFEGASEAGQSALERHVFAHHRREVAETRNPSRRA
ncbi:MAG: PilZ domain-containing protein [Nevskia sp.]|nr:PilZ domain-containing protein [Nevskia sp.]